MQLKVESKLYYGILRFYPACKASKDIALSMNKKTFNSKDILYLDKQGYQVIVVENEYDWKVV